MKYKYIAIEREYGSGGTRIAEAVAAQCGIPCYGREILERVSAKYSIPVEKIEDYEESATNSFLYTLFLLGKAQTGSDDILPTEGKVYVAEQEVIRDLANRGPAVFLGHCAAEALTDAQKAAGVLRVFIRADEADKQHHIVEDYGIPAAQAADTARRFDRKRANYYHVNTGQKWLDPANYDLLLDSGKLGTAGCAAAIRAVFETGTETN